MPVLDVVERVALWWGRKFWTGAAVVAVGLTVVGVGLAQAVPATVQATSTTTLHRYVVHTRMVTVRIRGRVIRRIDNHVVIVQVPRFVFFTHAPRRRHVVPAHVVRYRIDTPTPAVLGVQPIPVTVTVPMVVPGPTVTVPTTVTISGPTITVPTTVTVTVPVPPQPGGP